MLDKVQQRALRIIWEDYPEQQSVLHSLQLRRDMASLTIIYKVQEQRVASASAQTASRSVVAAPAALNTPHSRTSHYQQQFTQTYVWWWNSYPMSYRCPDDLSVAVC